MPPEDRWVVEFVGETTAEEGRIVEIGKRIGRNVEFVEVTISEEGKFVVFI
jgi:hypothetical protein